MLLRAVFSLFNGFFRWFENDPIGCLIILAAISFIVYGLFYTYESISQAKDCRDLEGEKQKYKVDFYHKAHFIVFPDSTTVETKVTRCK